MILARSERLVELEGDSELNKLSTNLILFEPSITNLNDALVAKSIHTADTVTVACEVKNAGDKDLFIKAGTVMGSGSEAEYASNKEFDLAVNNYKPLDLKALKLKAKTRSSTTKTNQSRPVGSSMNDQRGISTEEIVDHEIKTQLKKIRLGTNLSDEQKAELTEVLIRNMDAFQWGDNMGRTNLVSHSIPTGLNDPIVQKQYPIPSVAKESMRSQVEEMKAQDVIRESNSPWRSPVLLVRKKTDDGSTVFASI